MHYEEIILWGRRITMYFNCKDGTKEEKRQDHHFIWKGLEMVLVFQTNWTNKIKLSQNENVILHSQILFH